MFDKLVESRPEGADKKNRKTYFLLTGLILSVTLSTALVVSLFAEDLSLGTDNFAMVDLVAPVEITPPEPKLPEPEPATRQPETVQASPAAAPRPPTRQAVVARVDESPREAPAAVSTVQNAQRERPASGYFEVGKFDSDPVASGTATGRQTGGSVQGAGSLGESTAVARVVEEAAPPPPPVKTPPPPPAPKRPVTQSMGVINGKATSLPKPAYSAAARAVNAAGQVSVNVTIDENGRVVSANAVSGHPLLKPAAVTAARNARFSPTLLSGTPIRITGVIVYNFSNS